MGVAVVRCENPWKKDCKNNNIVVFIVYKGRKLPICGECWKEISKSSMEW